MRVICVYVGACMNMYAHCVWLGVFECVYCVWWVWQVWIIYKYIYEMEWMFMHTHALYVNACSGMYMRVHVPVPVVEVYIWMHVYACHGVSACVHCMCLCGGMVDVHVCLWWDTCVACVRMYGSVCLHVVECIYACGSVVKYVCVSIWYSLCMYLYVCGGVYIYMSICHGVCVCVRM